MEKIFKKSLALVLSAALCLTALVGCLTVSAADETTPTYAISTDAKGKVGDTVEVIAEYTNISTVCGHYVTVTFPANFTVKEVYQAKESADGETYKLLTAYKEGSEENWQYKMDVVEGKTAIKSCDIINFFASEGSEHNVTTGSLKFKFVVTIGEVVVGEYPVTIAVEAASQDEMWITPVITNGKITVESAEHVHTWGDWTYDSDNFNYKRVCSGCSEFETKEPVDSEETVDINFSGKALAAEDAIAISYYIPATGMDAYDGFYLEVAREGKETVKLNGKYSSGYGGEYNFMYRGIAAKEIGDTTIATIYVVKDGARIKGQVLNYNPVSYALSQIRKTKPNAKLQKVMVDLLNYGAEAQKYFKYNTTKLANADLTADELALGTQETPELTNYRDYGANNDTAEIKHTSPSLSVEDNVAIVYYMKPATYAGDLNSLSLVVTPEGGEATIIPFDMFTEQSGEYKVNYMGLVAKQMRTKCSFEMYENYGTDTQRLVSSTMTYSIESYAASRKTTSAVYNAAIAMMKYGDSSAAYFNK